MLPFEPESIESLRARYPDALRSVFNAEAVAFGGAPRPGQIRAHVFDSPDGVRLIVDREKSPGHPVYLHLTGSAQEGTPLRDDLRDGRASLADVLARILDRYRDISGDDRPLTFLGLSEDKGCPHWVRAEREAAYVQA